MKPLLRALALGVGPVVVIIGLGMAGGHGTEVGQLGQPAAVAATACGQPPVFKPGYQRGEGSVVPQGEGFKFNSDAWVEADLCSAGTLTITADGELAGDQEPQLTIVLGTQVLATPAFNKARTIQIPIPTAGRIYLGFLNDYYLADVRVAYLRDIKFTAPNCEGFKSVDVPKESAGTWYPASRAASLVRAMPMTLLPCAAGELTMQVQGREGNGAFPILTFRQGGQTIKTLQTGVAWEKIALPLNAETSTIIVSNAYGVTLANRNLNVRRIEFIPRRP